MNDDKADRIIELLEEIKERLSNIESNTNDISSVELLTHEALEHLQKIESKLKES